MPAISTLRVGRSITKKTRYRTKPKGVQAVTVIAFDPSSNGALIIAGELGNFCASQQLLRHRDSLDTPGDLGTRLTSGGLEQLIGTQMGLDSHGEPPCSWGDHSLIMNRSKRRDRISQKFLGLVLHVG
jgi:hypothetical protein